MLFAAAQIKRTGASFCFFICNNSMYENPALLSKYTRHWLCQMCHIMAKLRQLQYKQSASLLTNSINIIDLTQNQEKNYSTPT